MFDWDKVRIESKIELFFIALPKSVKNGQNLKIVCYIDKRQIKEKFVSD